MPSSTRGLRAVAACALAGSLAVGVAACGSSSSGASASAAGTSTSSSSSRYQQRLKYAECLRSHGVNVPDPTQGGGPPAGGGGGGGAGGGAGRAKFGQLFSTPTGQAAQKACQSLRGTAFGRPNLTPAQRQQFQQAAVKFAECMRAHNINIPDPTTNGAGGFGIFRELRGSSETNSPAFKTAFAACSSNLPNGGRFGRGGPGGTSTNSVGGPGA
jgi:hypothetical protein